MLPREFTGVSFGGLLGQRLEANLTGWLLPAPLANPAMSELFAHRDRQPRQRLVPWYGEFPGKYLTSAAAAHACGPDPRLERTVEALIARLAAAQRADGLLSPHPSEQWLTGSSTGWGDNPLMQPLWELWGYYHLILGLVSWYQRTGSAPALELARSAADGVAQAFLSGRVTLDQARAPENLGLAHGYALLYRLQGKACDREMMELLLERAETQRHYVEGALSGKRFYQLPWPRWEGLHALQALGERYRALGDERSLRAMLQLAEGIRLTDRHNTGGFSSGEQGCGNPYDQGAIETCCTVAWMALMTDCLQLTGDSKWADELELSLFNGALGAQHPTGRWWTYNTPMDGVRCASAHTIVFQALQGSPELNCCSVNGPRTLGMTAEWGLRCAADALELNYYGESRWSAQLSGGPAVHLVQHTQYPASGRVEVEVCPAEPARFRLRLRIPAWSERTRVYLAGQELPARPGEYLEIERMWQGGERITLDLDCSLHAWPGACECAGKAALYRGPLLLAFDQRFNESDPEHMPGIHPEALEVICPVCDWFEPQVLLRDPISGAQLCDFATAGATGSRYASWLPLAERPRRSCFAV